MPSCESLCINTIKSGTNSELHLKGTDGALAPMGQFIMMHNSMVLKKCQVKLVPGNVILWESDHKETKA